MATIKYGAKQVGTSSVDLYYGSRVWRAFVDTLEPIENAIRTSVTLVVNDVEFVGTIVGGDVNIGRGSYIVAGGAGAWRLRVAPTSLKSDSGIRLVTATNHLIDALRIVSTSMSLRAETATINNGTSVLGSAWVPIEDTAASLLDTLSSSWIVDRSGNTIINGTSSTIIEASRYAVVPRPQTKSFSLSPRTPLDISELFDAVGGLIQGDPFMTPQRIRTIRMVETDVLRLDVSS